MPVDLIVPPIMATTFNGGCYLIERLERHAANVEHSLFMALMCLTIFAFVVMLGHYAEEVRTCPQPSKIEPGPSD